MQDGLIGFKIIFFVAFIRMILDVFLTRAAVVLYVSFI
ncbi:hypothetical protein GGR08_000557 [Bartonella fuyuanensis]|uniref:Uncharacterized protein n=1 Tax=Bartonella fuyuanensis TaxID=1460968 RepID=A0A840DT59_9HYPH|nr:hypothetical protein [Bartonella fuyuanensis]